MDGCMSEEAKALYERICEFCSVYGYRSGTNCFTIPSPEIGYDIWENISEHYDDNCSASTCKELVNANLLRMKVSSCSPTEVYISFLPTTARDIAKIAIGKRA